MPSIQDILAQKGAEVLTVRPEATVLDAALLMNERRVGSVVVTHDQRVDGIFTERDILTGIVAARRDPAQTAVAEVMTREIACCRPDTPMEEARTVMKQRRIRHLPVIDEQKHLLGIVSIGDLNAWELDGHEQTIQLLHEYIYGRV